MFLQTSEKSIPSWSLTVLPKLQFLIIVMEMWWSGQWQTQQILHPWMTALQLCTWDSPNQVYSLCYCHSCWLLVASMTWVWGFWTFVWPLRENIQYIVTYNNTCGCVAYQLLCAWFKLLLFLLKACVQGPQKAPWETHCKESS